MTSLTTKHFFVPTCNKTTLKRNILLLLLMTLAFFVHHSPFFSLEKSVYENSITIDFVLQTLLTFTKYTSVTTDSVTDIATAQIQGQFDVTLCHAQSQTVLDQSRESYALKNGP